MGKVEGGLEADRLGETGETLVDALGGHEGDTEIVGGFGVARLQAEGGFEMGNRFGGATKSVERIAEIVFAFGANLEGDTTSFYITRKLKEVSVKITSIARGIPVGADLEYTDEVTLARSILNRTQMQLAPEIQNH